MRVLVVEDTPSVRTRVVALLASLPGVEAVTGARGTTDGLETLRSQTHDVVVLDLHLADGNGLDFFSRLKREFPRVLVYVMTNEATEHYRRWTLAGGADAFFDKSRDFEALAGAVGEAAVRAAGPAVRRR
jgi:DNA-binding NarL/FixJ family response regulator